MKNNRTPTKSNNSSNQTSNKPPQFLTGVIKRHPDGFGFFISDNPEQPDVFIPASAMKGAMTNDKVTITREKESDGRYKGEIIRITERAQKRVAGRFLTINDKYGIIKDESKGWGADLRIPLEHSMGAKNNDLVAAEIKSYAENDRDDRSSFIGHVTEIIGDARSALNDIKRVIINQGIPHEFSKATLEEAKVFDKNPSEKDFAGRTDLRHLPIITIDGATAKDFDDAVYVEMKNNGFHLYVAIADVSHYVKQGTSMDKEAYDRGTSVYFPNFVVPMLPESLSNGLCSLNPHVPRLALVAEMDFDFTGEMKRSHFYEGVIESKARVTYGQAQEIIDGTHLPQFDHVKENILRCADLAKVLMAKRFKEGSLDLEVPETELVIDGAGEPIDVIKTERLFAHRLIEELMLAANVATAKFLSSKEIPALYRTHEPPDDLKIGLLQNFINSLGSKTKIGSAKLQKQLTKALHEFQGRPQADVVHILTLRSMSQAKYTIDNIGHFGLGFDFYTHFTSPIRRYPDLIVHRLIKNQIGVDGYRLTPEDDLHTSGTWLSACEQRSAKSERQIQAIKKARFMEKMLGESFDGIISSVTKFGIFVLLKQYKVDGLVRLEDLGLEKQWVYDEENLRLVSKKTGFAYTIGDVVKVTVSMVDIDQGQINFALESASKTSQNPEKFSKNDSKSFDRNQERNAHREARGNKERSASRNKPRHNTTGTPKAENGPTHFKEMNEPKSKKAHKKSLKLRAIEYNQEHQIKSEYEVKPRYSSLADYLDQTSQKNRENSKNTGSKHERKEKPSRKFSNSDSVQDRKNDQKRGKAEGHSFGSGKTRSKKSHRKNKSR